VEVVEVVEGAEGDLHGKQEEEASVDDL